MNVSPDPRATSSSAPAQGGVATPRSPQSGRTPATPRGFAKLLSAARRGVAPRETHPSTPAVAATRARPAAAHAPGGAEPKDDATGDKIASREGREGGGESEGDARGGSRDDARELDALDPALRHAASLAPLVVPLAVAPASAAEAPLRARSLEELLPALVRRIAWAGDKHSGSVRLELGAGAYAGTTVIVHADGGRLRVEIRGTEGPELDRLRTRLDRRLRGHGLDVESVV